MQKKMFLLLPALLLLVSFSTTQAFGKGPAYTPAPIGPNVRWSAPTYHPEIGDKIVLVNGVRVHNEGEFRREIRYSQETIILGVVDHRTGQYYHLRTNLWSSRNQTRLGIYIRTSRNYDGVVVTGFVPNCPGMRCQYLRGEIDPVRDNVWYDNDDYEYEYEDGWYYY